MSRKKEFVVNMDNQTFMIREGESRRISIPMRMTVNKGILYITQSDIYSRYGEVIPKAYECGEDPEGAPAPSSEDLKSGREYEQEKGG